MAYYEHRLPCDATQIGRFPVVVGEAGLEQLLKATIITAVDIKAVEPEDFERVIVDWVFRKSVTGLFGIVTDDFGNVTGHFGDVTEEPSSVS